MEPGSVQESGASMNTVGTASMDKNECFIALCLLKKQEFYLFERKSVLGSILTRRAELLIICYIVKVLGRNPTACYLDIRSIIGEFPIALLLAVGVWSRIEEEAVVY